MTDTGELYARGLRRRKKMFGDADVEKRMAAAGGVGAPLQNVIKCYVFGGVWGCGPPIEKVYKFLFFGGPSGPPPPPPARRAPGCAWPPPRQATGPRNS